MLFLKEKLQTGRITVKARRTGGNEGFLMFFHASGPERYMFCNYGAAGNHFSAIQGTPAEGLATKGGGDIQGPIEKDRWYDISLVLTKNSAEMSLDGKRVSRIEAESLPTFFATAGYHRDQKMAVVRATNYRDVPVPVTIELAGTQGDRLDRRAHRPPRRPRHGRELARRTAAHPTSAASPPRLQPQVHRQTLPALGQRVAHPGGACPALSSVFHSSQARDGIRSRGPKSHAFGHRFWILWLDSVVVSPRAGRRDRL